MIISYHKGGLCNRLKSLLSTMRLSDDYKVIWPRNSYVNCSFNDLFENKIELCGKFRNWRDVENKFGSVNWRGSWRFIILPGDNISHKVDFMYHNTPSVVKEAYLRKIRILKPIKYVSSEVESFSKQFDDKTVSVSIRSWSDIQHKSSKRRSKTFNIKYFINAMNDMEDVSAFFITSDNYRIIEKLSHIFPNKIISYPNRTFKGDAQTIKGMQDILIDLFIGGKNKRFIASHVSTYSELQWWFGGCNADVRVVKNWGL